MRKMIILIMMIILLTGCSENKESNNAADEAFIEIDTNNIKGIYTIVYNSYGNKGSFGGGVSNADASMIKGSVSIGIDKNEFNLSKNGSLKLYISIADNVEISTTGDDKNTVEIKEPINIKPEKGKTYKYILNGSFDEGFSLEEIK